MKVVVGILAGLSLVACNHPPPLGETESVQAVSAALRGSDRARTQGVAEVGLNPLELSVNITVTDGAGGKITMSTSALDWARQLSLSAKMKFENFHDQKSE